MLSSKSFRTISTLALCLFLFLPASLGQNFSFKNYGSEYGIPDGFVYTINQSDDGFLWVGTGNGIAIFDGYEYYRISYPDSVETRNTYVSFKDNHGTIWFGCSDGSVFYTQGRKLIKLDISNERGISQIMQGPDSLVYIMPQGKTFYSIGPSNTGTIKEYPVPEDYNFFSGAFDEEGNLLAGSQGRILVMKNQDDSLIIKNIIEGFDYSTVSSICRSGIKGSYLVGTEDNGLFIMHSKGYRLERVTNHPEWASLNIKSIMTDTENRIWVSTNGSGVFQFRLLQDGSASSSRIYNTGTGLTSDDTRLVFRDMEGNYWFGFFGEGLSKLVSYAFGFYRPGANDQQNNILFIDKSGENYILGTPEGYHILNASDGSSGSFTPLSGRTGSTILSYNLDDQGRLWIGTNGNGLWVREPEGQIRRFFRSGDRGLDEVRDIRIDESIIWLGTTNGILAIDSKTGSLTRSFGMEKGLPHNNISKLLLHNGFVYIGTESDRLYRIDNDTLVVDTECMMLGNSRNRILALAVDNKGAIWSATQANGVFVCYSDSVLSKTRTNGLFSNYCYSIMADSKSNIWIGHEKGFSKIDDETGIVKTYGADYAPGGQCNADAMYEAEDGTIFIGTTSGVIIYKRNEDFDRNIAPYNNITSIIINDREYSYHPEIRLPYGKYRITINYAGINFSDPEKVFYSTYLENFDADYSLMTADRKVSYNLADGRYMFHLVSVDENGISNNNPLSFRLAIARPLYKKWWFLLFMTLLIVTGIILIIRHREKSQNKLREYLEDELEKRTSVIMKQKSEIEIQNLEITDSINYAKRIQSSILPDIGKLKDNFREAFILFRPRDIVSGDFYWFDKVDDDKFIVVCADSTGHGVPGAFMSMIGSTLLQDIVTRKKITRPSQILGLLDKQIFSTLNQNVDLGVSNDGMDMVVCEFNLLTRHLRFASAMRPIILVVSGESFYIKGNRSSVGGESVIEKYFDDQEYYLNQGDTIYMFSDGFPDQFGGADGKKMKIARLKKLIDQIITLPMKEQEAAVSAFFSEWKGSYDQVDDILMLGIRM